MQALLDNTAALITMYLPVVGTYFIQFVQWFVMWGKMKASQTILEAKQDKTNKLVDLNEQIIKDNYELKLKINKLITLLQHYEEKDNATNKEIKKD